MKWWDWSEPAFTFAFITIVIAFLSFLATVAIPIGLWKLGKKGSEDTQKVLDEIKGFVYNQRLEHLMERLVESRNRQMVTLFGREIRKWPEGSDRDKLARLYWSNPVAPLPKDLSDLSEGHVDCIMDSLLERCRIRGNCSEHELESFIKRLQQTDLDVSYDRFAKVYTDPESALRLDNREGLQLYRELVRSIPELSSYLIGYAGPSVLKDFQYGGFNANILTGVLLGSVENIANNNMKSDSPKGYKYTLLSSLANGMYGGGLFYGLGNWDNFRYPDTIIKLAALIVETLGSVSKTSSQDEQHLMMRSIQRLPFIVGKIPQQALKNGLSSTPEWGLYNERVHRGVEALKNNQPALWKQYGQAIETELDKIGTSWRNP